MRLLVVLSGFILTAAGAFCFAVYTNTFANVAFVVGFVMILAGVGNSFAYVVSGHGTKRLTETTILEGLVTLFCGISILANQVTDSIVVMFFGIWLTVCGVSRFSQALYVSHFNTRDWSKIIPLSAITTILGMVMMLPWLVSSVMPLMLIGGGFLLDGLSMIVFSMYMKGSNKEMSVGEARAKARAEARKEEHDAKSKERDRVRNLSREERIAEQKQKELEEEEEAIKRAQAKASARAARRAAMLPEEDRTIRLTDEESESIRKIAQSMEQHDDAVSKVRASNLEEIESLRNLDKDSDLQKLNENHNKNMNFDEDDNHSEKVDREDYLKNLDSIIEQRETVVYKNLDLEELVAEPMAKAHSQAKDEERFTRTLYFNWKED